MEKRIPEDTDRSDDLIQHSDPAGPDSGGFFEEFRLGSLCRLFSFETMLFPIFAKYVFTLYVVLVLLLGLGGVVSAFTAMARIGFSDGMYSLLQTVAMVVVLVIGGRVAVELTMVVFKINEGVQDIRRRLNDPARHAPGKSPNDASGE